MKESLKRLSKVLLSSLLISTTILAPIPSSIFSNSLSPPVNAAVTNGWEQTPDGTWYYYENGKKVTGWKQIDGSWYYFINTGAMKTGWFQDYDGKYYYFDPTSGKMRTGWIEVYQKWYYLLPKTENSGEKIGEMAIGWRKINNLWYYFSSSGAMLTGWQYINSVWYFFKDSGAMADDEWITDSKGETYYITPGGSSNKSWSTMERGTKDFSFESGKRLVYDIYSTTYNGNGYEITWQGGLPILHFKGWAILFGHKPHNAYNQSTYIVVQNAADSTQVRGYKTTMKNWSATEDVEYNKAASTSTTVWNECAPGVINKNNSVCNMRYDSVGFEASIPLNDLIQDPWSPSKWKFYIVKEVEGKMYWDYLIMPITLPPQNWWQGTLELNSEVDANALLMNGTNVIKRTYPHQQNGTGSTLGYFTTGKIYYTYASNEESTAVWYGVNDPATGSLRWTSSPYWTFYGSQAVIKYTPIYKPPVPDFSVSPSPLYLNTTATFTNKSYDPAGFKLTYKWWYMKPGTNTWVEFSSAKDPKLLMDKRGDWKIYLRATNEKGKYADIEKTVKVENRPPIPEFSWSPTPVYKDTLVTFKDKSTDPDNDSLTYNWWYQEPNSTKWVMFSNSKNPTLTMNIKGDWKIRLDVYDGFEKKSREKTVTVENRGPVANFVWNPTTIYNNTTVKFTNQSYDNDGDTLTYQWEYQQTSSDPWTIFSSNKDPSRNFNIRGKWKIRLTVSDGIVSDSIVKELTVQNRNPVAGFSTNKASYYNNETISIIPSATDPDNDPLSYTYRITRPDGSQFTLTSPNPSFGSLQIGTYTIKQTVSDGYGGSDSITKTVVVVNRPPIAGFNTDKSVYKDNETVYITSTASDPDKHALTHSYEVTKPDGSKFTLNTANPNFSNLQAGTYTIKQTVTDPYNLSANISKTIIVEIGNNPPVAGFKFNKSKYYKSEKIQILSTAMDPDGDVLTYSYEITRPDNTKIKSSAKDPSFIATMPGTYTVKQTVTDPKGASDTAIKTQWVQTLPTPGFTTNKTSYFKNEAVSISSSAFDEDGGTVSHLYEVTDPSGDVKTYAVSNPVFSTLLLGTYTIKQTITDDEGDKATITKTIVVMNRPPAAGFDFDKTKYYKTNTIKIVNKATDPDNDSLTYLYEVTSPSGTKTNFSTAQPSFSANEVGTYIVKQTVTDPHGGTSSVTKSQWVQSLPTPGFKTDKATYYRGEKVTITSTAYDEDGGALTYLYEVTAPNGSKQLFSVDNPTFTVTLLGTYTIKQTVTDNEGDKANLSKTIQVNNRGPLAGFRLDKVKYYKNDMLTIVDNASDPDNDPLTYLYEVTKPSGGKLTFTSSNPSFKADEVGTYTIKQTVRDPSGLTDSETLTQWVQTLPTPGFNTDKTSYYLNETVKITSSAFDEDGGALTYNYVVTKPDGAKITFSDANPTFLTSLVGEYSIVQTVTDDEGDTATLSKTIEVRNKKPTITLEYSPDEPYEGDTVNICAKVKDPDGQKLDIKLYLKEENSSEKLVMTKTQVLSDTQHCYSLTSNAGRYDVRATVSDGYESTEVTTWFYSKPLTLKGHVEHTPDWLKKHQEMGNTLNQFYSGEKFLLSADTSPYPVESIKSTLIATRADGQTINRTVNLNGVSAILHTGELYDEQFLQPPTSLKKGPAKFEFEVKYRNGVIKKDVVSIEIIDHVYEVYRIHRKY
ncbi:PKD domain-containing protein [Neobacillus sp.]|uniref:PKD domain-containing protein n=1 Tax=Neobacillus sp. TaxID=2675273 RepID=UPI0035B53303